MNLKELLEKRAALLAELNKTETTAERFAEIRAAVDKLNYQIEQIKKDDADKRAADEAEKKAEELRAARLPNGTLADQKKAKDEEMRKAQSDELEKRAASLKAGKSVTMELRAVASTSTALGVGVANDITPPFEQIGTLDKLVNNTHLEGAGCESYKKPFTKSYGEGVITAEGTAPASNADPSFGYANINKVKIVAYCEVNEEVEKLPAPQYMAEINKATLGAWYKKVNSQIVKGKGSAGSGNEELVGIINAPASTIEAAQRKTIATVDENTLDNIIFDYGGDESVEGDAVILLNKLTLKEFAKVKGTDKRRAYDIVIKGDRGTINGIPFVCTSNLASFATVADGDPYIIYGKLAGYELAYFTPVDVAKSTDYKFKEGVIALKVTGFVGGAPAMWNGFMTVQKKAKSS